MRAASRPRRPRRALLERLELTIERPPFVVRANVGDAAAPARLAEVPRVALAQILAKNRRARARGRRRHVGTMGTMGALFRRVSATRENKARTELKENCASR